MEPPCSRHKTFPSSQTNWEVKTDSLENKIKFSTGALHHWNSLNLLKSSGINKRCRKSMKTWLKHCKLRSRPTTSNKEWMPIRLIPITIRWIMLSYWPKSKLCRRRCWKKSWANRILRDTMSAEVFQSCLISTAISRCRSYLLGKRSTKVQQVMQHLDSSNNRKAQLATPSKRWTATLQLQLSTAKWTLTIFKKWRLKCSRCTYQKKKAKRLSIIWKRRRRICSRKSRV